ncbi:ergothioneine biosynthesis protein EgtB [Candidimonas nitroreducens]|uniref:Sulfatase maturase n=1 Tax=Candidimonas nitroreducens TaxID=683354 RepID=A0A225MXA4_9BURK|nr:ergothioneine biosynthesis protein EgtB [Candidimonas nitroreducens]OWT65855.1 sulfatase maturase [Candidimonas nitroreducens]
MPVAGLPHTARSPLQQRYAQVRARSLELAAPLSAEDQCVQSMDDASPTKWHLAHTTWFFEAMVLCPHSPGYRPYDPRYFYLFNSYYEALGPRHPRPRRGLLTRPALDEIHAYRRHVDAGVRQLLLDGPAAQRPQIERLLVLGLQHEQQHQELLLTDILHVLWCNPWRPAYLPAGKAPSPRAAGRTPPRRWLSRPGGVAAIGHADKAAEFAFDNESPRHEVLLRPYLLDSGLVTCGQYAEFIADGGYQDASLWLSDGWARVRAEGWRAPLYWLNEDDAPAPQPGGWEVFGLGGLQAMDPGAPVSQISFYEAAAYAQWADARLPTEFEWEAAAGEPGFSQAADSVWQWTRSSYDPYPGFRAQSGALGEYNGKFMVGQLVLRGASCATPPGHGRLTYRNFFPPQARWQFSGLRLAKDD